MTGFLARRGNRPALIIGALLMIVWCWFVLRTDLPLLLAILATAAGGIGVLRRRRDIVAGLTVAVGSAAAPTVGCLIVMTQQPAGASDIVAVLTGCILLSPIPTVLAFSQRPPVISRPVNALIGSAILLLGVAPVAVFGDHGEGAPLLAASLTAACGTVWLRQRRAAAVLLSGLPSDDGWTDLGRRTLPGGLTIHRLLLGRGRAVVVSTDTVGDAAPLRALNHAVAVARTLRIPVSRVQPVVLSPRMAGDPVRRLVNTGQAAASVIIIGPSGLQHITRDAPRQRFSARRALLTAAALPTRPERTTR